MADRGTRRDLFGCSKSSLDQDKNFTGAGIHFHLKGGDKSAPGRVNALASSGNYLIGISMRHGHERTIHHQHRSENHIFGERDLYIRTLDEDYEADLRGSFSFVLIEIEHGMLSQLADEASLDGVSELRRTVGTSDPILGGLAAALSLSHQSELIRERLGAAIGIHLLETYAIARRHRRLARGGLSRRNQNLAKDLILSHLDSSITVSSLAEQCDLSRSAFARGFKESTGKTPYQWITDARLERSQRLLLDRDLSLEEIATSCGFADHSHFSRVFSAHLGEPPRTWRRKLT